MKKIINTFAISTLLLVGTTGNASDYTEANMSLSSCRTFKIEGSQILFREKGLTATIRTINGKGQIVFSNKSAKPITLDYLMTNPQTKTIVYLTGMKDLRLAIGAIMSKKSLRRIDLYPEPFDPEGIFSMVCIDDKHKAQMEEFIRKVREIAEQ